METQNCNLCPNHCGVDRTTKKGACGELNNLKIAKYYLHPYEEPFISGTNGSGTIFFTGCSLKCVFCQNYELSRSQRGKQITCNELADIFKQLEKSGAHNINLVNPTHFLEQIYQAVKIYKPNVPIVYNTHGYESLDSLKIADKFVDIYLPDFKYYSSLASVRYTNKSDYYEVCSKAISYMMQSRKTTFNNDLMQTGVCVRHLILPLNVKDSCAILEWFSKNQRNDAYISLMAQYTPFGDIKNFKELNRPITKREYDAVVEKLYSLDIKNYLLQELTSSSQQFIPSWDF